jgi:peptide/nickel transport system substrate-binding protein
VARKYPYDPARAEQLLAEAGWKKGSDGVLVNQSGARFSVELRGTAGPKDQEQTIAAIASYLKAVGIETKLNLLPDRVDNDDEHRNRWPGLYLGQHSILVEDWNRRFGDRTIPSEQNKFTLDNVSQWVNPQKQQVLDALDDTLDPQRRDELQVQFLKLFTEELPHLPLKYASEVTAYRSTVKGVPVRYESGGENYRTWNVHLWEKTG